jgi:hypothetical protein
LFIINCVVISIHIFSLFYEVVSGAVSVGGITTGTEDVVGAGATSSTGAEAVVVSTGTTASTGAEAVVVSTGDEAVVVSVSAGAEVVVVSTGAEAVVVSVDAASEELDKPPLDTVFVTVAPGRLPISIHVVPVLLQYLSALISFA